MIQLRVVVSTGPEGASLPFKVDAFLVGVPKAATSTLAAMLASHPAINFARTKEPSYFWPEVGAMAGPIALYVFDRGEYEALFDGGEAAVGRVRMEASHYIGSVAALSRVRAHNGDAKIIVVLRDPVERAVASYRHLCRMGHEDLSFEDSLRKEPQRVSENFGLLYRYREISDYRSLLAPLIEMFPRRQILYLLFEEVVADLPLALRRIEDFLGIAPATVAPQWLNEGSVERGRLAHATIGALRPIARRFLPAGLRAYAGRKTLRGLQKFLKIKRPVDEAGRAGLVDLYDDMDWVSTTCGLRCRAFWPAPRSG